MAEQAVGLVDADAELDYARTLGAQVIIEKPGDVAKTLSSFARIMGIDYLLTGRRPRSLFTWRPPLMERIQRKLPNAILIVV